MIGAYWARNRKVLTRKISRAGSYGTPLQNKHISGMNVSKFPGEKIPKQTCWNIAKNVAHFEKLYAIRSNNADTRLVGLEILISHIIIGSDNRCFFFKKKCYNDRDVFKVYHLFTRFDSKVVREFEWKFQWRSIKY